MKREQLVHLPGIAGIDEAGRGPLAGPVVAAAVVLGADFDVSGIADSKVLAPDVREAIASRIREHALWSVAAVDAGEVDRLNIHRAALRAMAMAITGLSEVPPEALVDGNRVPPTSICPCRAVVKGDARFACIAAAAILAKTQRDAIMRSYAETFPQYGFDRHFGYGTPEHLAAIERFGPCPIHRLSFHPFRRERQPCLTLDD